MLFRDRVIKNVRKHGEVTMQPKGSAVNFLSCSHGRVKAFCVKAHGRLTKSRVEDLEDFQRNTGITVFLVSEQADHVPRFEALDRYLKWRAGIKERYARDKKEEEKMKEKERIERYGEAAHEKRLKQALAWNEAHPEKVMARNREQSRKGGKYYATHGIYNRTGLQGERNKIRAIHRSRYQPFKKIIAPDSQLHHQWIPETSKYTGVGLVEADQHMRGFIDVIQILEGEITLYTEEEIRNHVSEGSC